MLRRIRFWTTLFSLFFVLLNLFGQDDKNILLFLTNPLNLIGLEDATPQLRKVMLENIFWFVQYALHLGFWYTFGLIIDWMIGRKKTKEEK